MGKKGRKRLQTNPSILKTAHLACHAWVHASTFDAGISCRNWPKCLSFRGAEMNFRGECETKVIFLVFWNAWTALMVKSQWIQTINVGPHQLFSCLFYWPTWQIKYVCMYACMYVCMYVCQSSARQNGLPFSPWHRQLECSYKSILEQSWPGNWWS